MNSNQEKSKDYYSKLAKDVVNKRIVAGRYSFDEGKEEYIVKDIILKLDIKEGGAFFDIGCGGGIVTELLIKHLKKLNLVFTLMDVGEIIESINANVIPSIDLVESSFKLIKGYFPEDYLFDEQRFDRILLYSVLHYTDDPYMVIDKALTLLKPYGKLLLGDLPNINQKGRFLSSEKGKIFEAEYKKVPVNKLPVYKDHADFVNKMKADENYYSLLNDELIYKIQKSYTEQGYDVFILPQPNELPFSKTRHDILICKYD